MVVSAEVVGRQIDTCVSIVSEGIARSLPMTDTEASALIARGTHGLFLNLKYCLRNGLQPPADKVQSAVEVFHRYAPVMKEYYARYTRRDGTPVFTWKF